VSDPNIEFPCEYPIKVIGDVQGSAVEQIVAVVRKHAPEVTPDHVSLRESSKGNFHSVRVNIWATGEPQLRALHADLLALSSVRLVL